MTAILESITNQIFELAPETRITRRKSDPFDPDMQIDPTIAIYVAISMADKKLYMLARILSDKL